MKKRFIIGLLLICQYSFSQTIIGKWVTIDDETGNKKAIVELYEKYKNAINKKIAESGEGGLTGDVGGREMETYNVFKDFF